MTAIFDMINLLVPFMILLSLADINNGQDYGLCNYIERVKPGKPVAIFNLNYPLNYPRGMTCKWTVESEGLMKVLCHPFEIPYSQGCVLASLMIHDATEELGLRHCGTGDFSSVSTTNRLVFKLTSGVNMPTGRFYCTVEAVASSPMAPSPTPSSPPPLKPTQRPSPQRPSPPSPASSTPSPTSTSPPDDENSCRCGWKSDVPIPGDKELQSRIVGGENAGKNEYPMMSGLFDNHLSMLFCGASIINARQVLTAAHCLKNKRPKEIRVMVGGHDISQVMETNSTNFFRIASTVIHPLYDDSTEDYDIAVITIDGEMDFDVQVGPVCLPFQHSPDTFGGSIVEVLGWGSTEFAGGPTNTLQKAGLSVVTNNICSKTYKTLSTRQLCTRGPGRDSCQFDSGGPVLWQNPTSRRIVIVGIISLGSVCADGEPAVNTRIGAFINWIVEHTPPEIQYCMLE